MRLKTKSMLAIKLWLGIIAALVCLLIGAKPVQAFVSEYSFLKVNGEYMVRGGKLLKTTVYGAQGTAVYDETTNTLTLDNFTTSYATGVTMQFMSHMKIVLKGTNTMNGSGTGIGMTTGNEDESLTISGGGTLNITAGSWEQQALGISVAGADLTIENCTINIASSYIPLCSGRNMTIKNSNIKAVRTGYCEVNDTSKSNNIYNIRYGFPGLSALGSLIVEASTLDVTGINYGIGVGELPILSECTEITDENGNPLHIVKVHWPSWWMNNNATDFEYAYSASEVEDLYYFDELPNRVLIKEKTLERPAEGGTNNAGTSDGSTPGTSSGSNSGTPDGSNAGTSGTGNAGTGNADGTGAAGNSNNNSTVTRKVNGAYYRGVPSSGKVAYVKPANKNLTKAAIPATVRINGKTCKVISIQKNAFKNCKKLKSVTIGKNVQTIGERAFYQCSALTKITLPANVKTIRKEAFANCKRLKSVKLGKRVQTIGQRAFYQCSALTSVTFPENVKTIQKEAFANCKKLKSIKFGGKKLKTVGKAAFKNTKSKIKVTVPKSKYKNYKKILNGRGLKKPVYKKA